MKHVDLLRALLPPVSYDPNAKSIAVQLEAEGDGLDDAQTSAEVVLGAVTPFYAGELISDWERVVGITPATNATQDQRVEAVVEKVRETGGLSIPYFTALAKRMGYTIKIEEPQPFSAGVSRAGEQLWVTDIIWVWKVIVSGTAPIDYRFRAGTSGAGDSLHYFSDPVIEQVFKDLKPAFTFVYFAYTGN
ncbi:YmfQ family protein [Paraburkholderia sp. BR14263]|uniref:YmfQ family protein n=1 Tax=unclassified Paraburkholderia TaxID=2615204 RepID=UPI0034CE3FF0